MEQPKPRKKRDTSRKREEILDGAIEAFREFGYERVNMDQVAEKAGASKRTLYNHFSSKEELLQAVVGRYLKRQQEIKAAITYEKTQTLAEQMSRFVDGELYLVDSPERQTLAKVLTSIFLWNTELALKTQSAYNPGEAPIVTWLKAAAADGRISQGDWKKAEELFYGLVQGLLTWPPLFMPELTKEFVAERKKIVIDIFLRELGAAN